MEMNPSSPSKSLNSSAELETFYQDMQIRTLNLVILFLAGASALLYGLGLQHLDQAWYRVISLGLIITILLAWLARRVSFFLASALLVVGCLWAIYYGIGWGQTPGLVALLVIPAGLATLMLGGWVGIITAAIVSALLVGASPTWLPLSTSLRWAGIAEMWASVGLIWLALQPLLKSVEWTWDAYERSQDLLQQARQAQGQLHQALEDAAAANQQLTRLNQLAQSLRQVAEEERQAKQQFVASVSHELRTPLNMIIGFCEVILRKLATYGKRALPQALLADLDVVLRNSQHLSELIDDVLDLSQIDAGKVALFKERVALAEIIQAAAIAIQPLYTSKGLSLETQVPDDLPPIYCDRTRIREVLLNLLSNAGRFTHQGGVRVKAQSEDGVITISVADTGTGISSEAQERLFQPFQQADGSVRQRYGGTCGVTLRYDLLQKYGAPEPDPMVGWPSLEPFLETMGDLAALIAPRPLLIETGTQDDLNGARGVVNVLEQMDIAKKAYELLAAPDCLSHDIFEGEHRWNGVKAYPWLDRWLR